MGTEVLQKYWSGDGSLARLYWVYGFGGSIVLGAVLAGFAMLEPTTAAYLVALSVLGGPYTVWFAVAMWRCAHQAEHRRVFFLARLISVLRVVNGLAAFVYAAKELPLP